MNGKMLYGHLSLAYHNGGLGALYRQGADATTIWSILEDSYDVRGITKDEARLAVEAAKNAEQTKRGRIARLEHEKFQPALDYFLFNFKGNLVLTPTKAFYRGSEETLEKIKKLFTTEEVYDDISRIIGDIGRIVEEFRKITD